MRQAWEEQVLCRGRTSLFFSTAAQDITEALKTCARCPVVEPCREFGEKEAYGVWGGTTPRDRGFRVSANTGFVSKAHGKRVTR